MTERDQTSPHGASALGAGRDAERDAYGPGPVAGSPFGGPAAHPGTAPQYATTPIALRRPDAFAALVLVLAGIAAGASLLTTWLDGRDESGLDLLRRGFDTFGEGVGEVLGSGFWQPLTLVLGGGVLLLLGLLLFVPARTHRFLGLLALLVSLAAAAAVLVPLSRAGWDLGEFDLGFWFAVAVPVLGLLGALKALLTGRKYSTRR